MWCQKPRAVRGLAKIVLRRPLFCLAQVLSDVVPLRCATLLHQLVVRGSSGYVANAVWGVLFMQMRTNMDWSIDAIGWCGAMIVLLAYALVSVRKVEGDSVFYQVLNLSGAALLVANTVYLDAYPSAFVNVIWIAIGGYTLYRRRVQRSPV